MDKGLERPDVPTTFYFHISKISTVEQSDLNSLKLVNIVDQGIKPVTTSSPSKLISTQVTGRRCNCS